MENKIPEVTSKIQTTQGAHIFYLTEQTAAYINNALVFILDGIRSKDHVLVVENKRLTPLIYERLREMVSENELATVHFFDNFHLYWQKGDFLPSTIIDYFQETVDYLPSEGQCYRTWGHIEWGTQQGLEKELLSYEKKIKQLVSEHHLIAVCAYDAFRVEQHLQEQLGVYHNYIMTDDHIMSSLSILGKEAASSAHVSD